MRFMNRVLTKSSGWSFGLSPSSAWFSWQKRDRVAPPIILQRVDLKLKQRQQQQQRYQRQLGYQTHKTPFCFAQTIRGKERDGEREKMDGEQQR